MAEISSGAVTSAPNAAPDISTFDSSIYNKPDWFADDKSGSAASAYSFLGSIINNFAADMRARAQRKWAEKMFDKQNEFSLDMWNRTNEYNSPLAQKGRLTEAGLNPAFYGLDGSSASSFESAQPLNYQRADTQGIVNPLGVEMALKQAELANVQAATNKIESETDSTVLDNKFKQETFAARAKGISLANHLTSKQIDEIDDKRKEIASRIAYLAEQVESEQVKRDLMHAEKWLKETEARKIVELLPYEKSLMSAQTEAQRAQASLAFWQASIQKGLFEGHIVDYEIERVITDIQRSESTTRLNEVSISNEQAIKDLNELRYRIKSGSAIDVDSIPKWMITDRLAATLWNSLLQRGNEVSESLGGVLGPILGFVAGKGAAAASTLRQTGQYTNLYGPDGKPMSQTKW